MRKARVILAIPVVLVAFACGSSNDPGTTTATTGTFAGPTTAAGGACTIAYSCDYPNKSKHACAESSVVQADSKTDCEKDGGVYGTGCPHANAIGACQAGGGAACATGWYYSDQGAQGAIIESGCKQGGGTWIKP